MDFKSDAGEGIEDGVLLERTDVCLCDHPVDPPPRMRTRNMDRREDAQVTRKF